MRRFTVNICSLQLKSNLASFGLQYKTYDFVVFSVFSENVVMFSEKDEFDKLKPTPPKAVKR